MLHRGDLMAENINKVIAGMYAAVNQGGTGQASALPGVEMCGKTGTAQLASNEVLKGTALGQTMKDNAWFIGFAPRQAPEIVVAALFEGGEHGADAGPIVRDVIKAYFDKKARLRAVQVAGAGGPRVLELARPAAGRPGGEAAAIE
jgi:penicillin-binding protein 2